MSLQQRIQDDLRDAMKARDRDRTSALRMVLAAMRNEAVAQGRGPQGELDDDTVQRLLRSEVKRRQEAAEAFRKGGREEQGAREEAEAELYASYLPEPLSDEELGGLIDEAIDETGAGGPGDMGKVMAAVMGRVRARADGKRVADLVRARLAG